MVMKVADGRDPEHPPNESFPLSHLPHFLLSHFLRFRPIRVSCLYSARIRELQFSETRPAPVLLTEVLADRTPLYRTGCERYSPSFLEQPFSETKLPVLGRSVGVPTLRMRRGRCLSRPVTSCPGELFHDPWLAPGTVRCTSRQGRSP